MTTITDFEIVIAKPDEVKILATEAHSEKLWAIFQYIPKKKKGMIYTSYRRAMSDNFTNRTNIPANAANTRCINEMYMGAIRVNGVMIASAVVHFSTIMVYVKTAFRRKGLGTSLVNALCLHYPEIKRAHGTKGIEGSLSFFKAAGIAVRT